MFCPKCGCRLRLEVTADVPADPGGAARELVRLSGFDSRVEPTGSAGTALSARRPATGKFAPASRRPSDPAVAQSLARLQQEAESMADSAHEGGDKVAEYRARGMAKRISAIFEETVVKPELDGDNK